MKIILTTVFTLICIFSNGATAKPELSIFAGKKKNIKIFVPALKGQAFAWLLSFKHRSLVRGHGIIDIHGNGQIELTTPKIRAGITMNTVLKYGSKDYSKIMKVNIYNQNPFAGRLKEVREVQIWSDSKDSPLKEMFEEFKLPYISTHTPESATKKNIMIISGINLNTQPGITDILVEKCRKGSTVICFLPKKSPVTIPGTHVKDISIEQSSINYDDQLQFQQKGDLTISNIKTGEGCSGITVSIPPGKILFFPINRISTMQNSPMELYSFAKLLLKKQKHRKGK